MSGQLTIPTLSNFIPYILKDADFSTLSTDGWNLIDPKTGFPMALLLKPYLDLDGSSSAIVSLLKNLNFKSLVQPMSSMISAETESVISFSNPINNITGLLYLSGDQWKLIAQEELAALPPAIKIQLASAEDELLCKRCPLTSLPISAIVPLMDFTQEELTVLATDNSSFPPVLRLGKDEKPLLPKFFSDALSADHPVKILMDSKKKYYTPTDSDDHVFDHWGAFIKPWSIVSEYIQQSLLYNLSKHICRADFLNKFLDEPDFVSKLVEPANAESFIKALVSIIPSGEDDTGRSAVYLLTARLNGQVFLKRLLDQPGFLSELLKPANAESFIKALCLITSSRAHRKISGFHFLTSTKEGQAVLNQLSAQPGFASEFAKSTNAISCIKFLKSIISSGRKIGQSGLYFLTKNLDGRAFLQNLLDQPGFLSELVKPANAESCIKALSSIIPSGEDKGMSGFSVLARTTDGLALLERLSALTATSSDHASSGVTGGGGSGTATVFTRKTPRPEEARKEEDGKEEEAQEKGGEDKRRRGPDRGTDSSM